MVPQIEMCYKKIKKKNQIRRAKKKGIKVNAAAAAAAATAAKEGAVAPAGLPSGISLGASMRIARLRQKLVRGKSAREEKKIENSRRPMAAAIFLLHLLFQTLVLRTFNVFQQTSSVGVGDTRRRYIIGDVGVETVGPNTGTYRFLMPTAAAFLVFYCVGLPALLFTLLYRAKHHKSGKNLLLDESFHSRFGFLYEGYQVDGHLYAWEVWVMLRKVISVAIGAFVEDSYLQAVFCTLLLSMSLAAHLHFRPYEDPGAWLLNSLESLALVAMLLIQLLGFLYFRLDAFNGDSSMASEKGRTAVTGALPGSKQAKDMAAIAFLRTTGGGGGNVSNSSLTSVGLITANSGSSTDSIENAITITMLVIFGVVVAVYAYVLLRMKTLIKEDTTEDRIDKIAHKLSKLGSKLKGFGDSFRGRSRSKSGGGKTGKEDEKSASSAGETKGGETKRSETKASKVAPPHAKVTKEGTSASGTFAETKEAVPMTTSPSQTSPPSFQATMKLGRTEQSPILPQLLPLPGTVATDLADPGGRASVNLTKQDLESKHAVDAVKGRGTAQQRAAQYASTQMAMAVDDTTDEVNSSEGVAEQQEETKGVAQQDRRKPGGGLLGMGRRRQAKQPMMQLHANAPFSRDGSAVADADDVDIRMMVSSDWNDDYVGGGIRGTRTGDGRLMGERTRPDIADPAIRGSKWKNRRRGSIEKKGETWDKKLRVVVLTRETQDILGLGDEEHAKEVMAHLAVMSFVLILR